MVELEVRCCIERWLPRGTLMLGNGLTCKRVRVASALRTGGTPAHVTECQCGCWLDQVPVPGSAPVYRVSCAVSLVADVAAQG